MGRPKKAAGQEFSGSIDDCLAPILELGKRKFGEDKVYTGKESEARLVGLELPALSLRYLFQMNILPLSRMMQINGVQESSKSAFLYELYRWFRCNGGKAYHIENESKDSDTLRNSILNYDDRAVELMISDYLEMWQQELMFLLHDKSGVKGLLLGTKERPGLGKTSPLIFGLDSLMGKASKEFIEKVEAQGYTDRAFPLEALKISSYLKVIPQQFVGWPFFFAATNHLKPQKTQGGAIDYHSAGGYSLKFQETFEIRMSKIGDIKSVERPGVSIKFVMAKNSLGPGRKVITADMRWYYDRDDNYRQKTYWDWHAASIVLLEDFKGGMRDDLQAICDLHIVVSGGKKVWSNVLGIPRDDPVPLSHAGAILEERKDLLTELHKTLGIRECSVFKPGVSYSQQLQEATLAIERAEGYAPEVRDGEPVDESAECDAE